MDTIQYLENHPLYDEFYDKTYNLWVKNGGLMSDWKRPELLSNGLAHIGYKRFISYLENINKKTPIIDVGSGYGNITEELIQLGYDVIPVDPINAIYGPYEHKEKIIYMPKYDTVNTLIVERPEIISNNTLLLNWCTPDDSIYDIESIMLLKPNDIIVIFDSSGSAGGTTFHHWLGKINDSHVGEYVRKILIEKEKLIC